MFLKGTLCYVTSKVKAFAYAHMSNLSEICLPFPLLSACRFAEFVTSVTLQCAYALFRLVFIPGATAKYVLSSQSIGYRKQSAKYSVNILLTSKSIRRLKFDQT